MSDQRQGSDSRYPYTYACDFIRSHCTDFDEALQFRTPTISRAQASQVMYAFELVFDMSHEYMARKLADYAKSIGSAP